MYRQRPGLFLGIGLVMLPISIVVALLQTLIVGAAGFAGIDADGEGATLLVMLVVALLTTLTLAGVGLFTGFGLLPAQTEQPVTIPRIGYLGTSLGDTDNFEAFRDGFLQGGTACDLGI